MDFIATISSICIKHFNHIHHLLPSLSSFILIDSVVWMVVLFRGGYSCIFNIYFIFNYVYLYVTVRCVHMSADALRTQSGGSP